MNFKIPVAGLLIGLLVACSETKHDPTVQSTPKQQQVRQSKLETKQLPETGAKKTTNPFDRASFPKESCGDKLPNDSKTDTAKLYPVFIEYNESNLQTIKANYCRDAFKTLRKDKGQEAIQVASFTGEERANQFKEFLGNKLDRASAEVGEPRIRAVNPTDDVKNKGVKITSKEGVIKAAKLTSKQVENLVSNVGDSKDFEKNNVVVLPTYLPDGFRVDKLIVWRGKSIRTHTLAGYYEIVYKNPYGACFLIGGGEILPRGEGYENYGKISNIQSPALGSLKLGFKESDKQDGGKFIEFAEPMGLHLKGRNEYKFESPFFGAFLHAGSNDNYYKLQQKYKDCKMMNLQDAKRVVQSFQFLNP
jgi:ribosomal protein L22